MMRLWTCFNCETMGRQFQAEKPVCPGCGADGDDPASSGCVAPRVVIHFDPPHPKYKNRGLGTPACQPALRIGAGGIRASGDVNPERQVVNCPACLASAAYKAVAAGLDGAYRVPDIVAPTPPAGG